MFSALISPIIGGLHIHEVVDMATLRIAKEAYLTFGRLRVTFFSEILSDPEDHLRRL